METRARSVALWLVWVLATGALVACSSGSAGSRSPGLSGAGSSSANGNPDGGTVAPGTSTPGTLGGGAVSTGGGSGAATPVGTASPWTDLPCPEIALTGGAASSPGGTAQMGGSAHFTSAGGIALDTSVPVPAPPAIPSVPASATSVNGAALSADVTRSGLPSRSPEWWTPAGNDTVRRITAGATSIISGTLRGADLGVSRQGFDIEAPGHTVYVTGTVDSSGGSGQAGGPLTIVADQVVVTGKLSTAGGAGAQPGAGRGYDHQDDVGGRGWPERWIRSGGDANGGDGATGARAGDVTDRGGRRYGGHRIGSSPGWRGRVVGGQRAGGAAGRAGHRLRRNADLAGSARRSRRRRARPRRRRNRRGGRGGYPHRRRQHRPEGDQRSRSDCC